MDRDDANPSVAILEDREGLDDQMLLRSMAAGPMSIYCIADERSIVALCDHYCSAVTMHRIQCCLLYVCPVICDCGLLPIYTVVKARHVPDDLWSLPR